MIELVMVIVILGILATFALPRFADLGGEARAAAVQGIGANLKSALALVHSQALVDNKAGAASATVTLEGQNIPIAYGYPSAGTSIKTAAQFSPASSDYTETTAPGVTTWDRVGAPGTCQVKYVQATGTSAPATVAVDTSGCK